MVASVKASLDGEESTTVKQVVEDPAKSIHGQ